LARRDDAAAPARKEKQRRKQAPARLNRARRGVTLEVTLLVGKKAGVHGAYPAEESGQLRFLGSLTRAWSEPLWLHHTVHSKPWQKQQTDHLSVIDRTDILQRMPEAHAPLAVAQRAYQTAWRCNLPMIGTLVRCNRRPG